MPRPLKRVDWLLLLLPFVAEVQRKQQPINALFEKHDNCEGLHLTFDLYDLTVSLKKAIRVRRQGEQNPIAYQITDTTVIAKKGLFEMTALPYQKRD